MPPMSPSSWRTDSADPEERPWARSQSTSSSPSTGEALGRITSQCSAILRGSDTYVSGSGTLVRAMLADRLVDELHLFMFPIALGTGDRLLLDGGYEILALRTRYGEDRTISRSPVRFGVLVVVLMALPAAAHADVYSVTSTADSGGGSLRAALGSAAASDSAPDEVQLDPALSGSTILL